MYQLIIALMFILSIGSCGRIYAGGAQITREKIDQAESIRNNAGPREDLEKALVLFTDARKSLGRVEGGAELSDIACAECKILASLGQYPEALAACREAAQAARYEGDRARLVAALCETADIHRIQGDSEEAETIAHEARELAEALQDPALKGRALTVSALTALTALRLQQASEHALRAVSLLSASAPASEDMAAGLAVAGSVKQSMSMCGEAHDLIAQSLEIRKRLGKPSGVAWSLFLSGDLEQTRKRIHHAKARLQEALVLSERLGAPYLNALVLRSLGRVARMQGEYPKALSLLRESADGMEKIGARGQHALGLRFVGWILTDEREYDKALDEYRKGIAEAETLNAPAVKALLRQSLGWTLRFSGKRSEASAPLEEAVAFWRSIGNPWNETEALLELALAKSARREYPAAKADIEKALSLSRSVKCAWLEARCLHESAAVHSSNGEREAAVKIGAEAAKKRAEAGDLHGAAITSNMIGNVHYAANEYPKAIERFEPALKTFQELGAHDWTITLMDNIANSYKGTSDFAKASDWLKKAHAIARETGSKRVEAVRLDKLGDLHRSWAKHTESLEFYESALARAKELNNDVLISDYANKLGLAHDNLTNYAKALEYYNTALELKRKLRNTQDEGIILSNIGTIYTAKAEYPKALEYLEQALALQRRFKYPVNEQTTLAHIAQVYRKTGRLDKAFETYSAALEINKRLNRPSNQADNLNSLALTISGQGRYAESLAYNKEALEIFERIGAKRSVQITLNRMAETHRQTADYDKAEELYTKSLAIARATGHKGDEAHVLGSLADTLKNKGDLKKALGFYQEAVEIYNKQGDREREAYALRDLGILLQSMDEPGKAIQKFKSSLEITKKIGDAAGEAKTLELMGDFWKSTSAYVDALDHYERALAIRERTGNLIGQAVVLNDIAWLYRLWGFYGKAMEYYDKALAIRKQIGDQKGQSAVLSMTASLNFSLGRYNQALENYETSLELSRSIGLRSEEVQALRNIGATLAKLGRRDESAAHMNAALELAQKVGDPGLLANTLEQMGDRNMEVGRYREAIPLFEEAARLRLQMGKKYGEVTHKLGTAHMELGDMTKAESYFKKLVSWGKFSLRKGDYHDAVVQFKKELELAVKSRSEPSRFSGFVGLGLAYEGLKQYDKAIQSFKSAVEIVERSRELIPEEQRANFLDSIMSGWPKITPYEGLCRVYLSKGNAEASLQIAEGSKARAFAETLTRGAAHKTQNVPAPVLKQDKELNDRYAALNSRLVQEWGKASAQAKANIEAQAKELRERREIFIAQLRESFPNYASTKYPEPINILHAGIEPREYVIEYEVTESGTIAYLIKGKTIVKTIFKPIERAKLEQLVLGLRRTLEMKTAYSFREKLKEFDLAGAQELGDILLGGIVSEIPKGDHVVIIPDECLGLIPFELLALGKGGAITDEPIPQVKGAEFFGDRNPISYYQSITGLTLARSIRTESPAEEKTLVFADPVFTVEDERLHAASGVTPTSATSTQRLMQAMADFGIEWPRLPMTGDLARNLKNASPDTTEICEGAEASKSNLLNRDLSAFRNILFATHGYAGSDIPDLREPALVLTTIGADDGFVRMSEAMGLKINSDVVFLLACQTGLGRLVSGEGPMGLGRAFQYAGAKSVIISLWSVAEKTSVSLAESFFKHVRAGKSRMEALAAARAEIRDDGYDHPFFWAPFILVGETLDTQAR